MGAGQTARVNTAALRFAAMIEPGQPRNLEQCPTRIPLRAYPSPCLSKPKAQSPKPKAQSPKPKAQSPKPKASRVPRFQESKNPRIQESKNPRIQESKNPRFNQPISQSANPSLASVSRPFAGARIPLTMQRVLAQRDSLLASFCSVVSVSLGPFNRLSKVPASCKALTSAAS